ncbi:MAG: UDPglucose 6-dehydrogenase [Pseudonocardiales bacterium]|jgi:nucleotide sugar dehydrogenase|nr:UDPglucose 6-dehydrogenase [Pseudonocardiales bacterium]
MKAAIIGAGTVGSAMRSMLSGAGDVIVYDPAHHDAYPTAEIAACDFAVVCVDTPMAADGSCDISNVRSAVDQVPLDRVLIKSTVPPGTTDGLAAATGKAVCFSPEYLGETPFHPWANDATAVPFAIVGGPPQIREWFLDRLAEVLSPETRLLGCSALDAEIIKYMENSFLATKVTFVNEFYEICRSFGADWHTVREGWLLDPRVGRSHSEVFPHNRGFAGKCLPKDVSAVVRASAEIGYVPKLLQEVLMSNERFRRKQTPEDGLER